MYDFQWPLTLKSELTLGLSIIKRKSVEQLPVIDCKWRGFFKVVSQLRIVYQEFGFICSLD